MSVFMVEDWFEIYYDKRICSRIRRLGEIKFDYHPKAASSKRCWCATTERDRHSP